MTNLTDSRTEYGSDVFPVAKAHLCFLPCFSRVPNGLIRSAYMSHRQKVNSRRGLGSRTPQIFPCPAMESNYIGEDKILRHCRRGKGTVAPYSRKEVMQAPQKGGGVQETETMTRKRPCYPCSLRTRLIWPHTYTE